MKSIHPAPEGRQTEASSVAPPGLGEYFGRSPVVSPPANIRASLRDEEHSRICDEEHSRICDEEYSRTCVETLAAQIALHLPTVLLAQVE